MAETDILNPVQGTSDDLGFNPNWSYASKLDVGDNMTYARPRRGPAIARETGVMGYTFEMVFVDCSWAKVQWLKQFYQQFKRGYFTIVDYDGGGRHHVGRFTNAPQATHTGNLKYAIQGLKFEEVQGARMVRYPDDWANDSYLIYALGDDLNALVASGTQSAATFIAQQTPSAVASGASIHDPSSYEMLCVDGNEGTYAQAEYTGWGFQMLFRKSDALGIIDLYFDGIQLILHLDLYAGTAASSGPDLNAANPSVILSNTGAPGAGSVLVTVTNVPLDAHRVKVVATGTKNDASSSYAAIYPALQVMA